MKKQGRSTDQALLRAQVNKKTQTFAQKRLAKDLQEIQHEKIPTIGVVARPLPEDLFVWHGNIKGPVGTNWAGGIFHIEMRFPQSYPYHPPTVTLFTTVPHPNVFGSYICLDLIEQFGSRNQGQGWSSAYSAQSVLTQLQSFLFQTNPLTDTLSRKLEIQNAVKLANQFKCPRCKHGGKLSCHPAFPQKQPTKEQFIIVKSENDLIKEGLICYHTKLSYTQKLLGLGLKISKIPRTGLIRQAEAYYDYISLKAYIKQSVNRTSNNQRITHWLPVYFGQGDNEQRFQKCLKKAILMIMTNTTKTEFQSDYVLQVFPKLILTTAFHIMSEKKHPSIRLIRILTHLHSMFLYCVRKMPEIEIKIKQMISKFLKNEQSRNKQNLSNLGTILAYLSVTDGYKFEDLSQTYFLQQLDRQVLWILKAVPQLLDDTLQKEADQLRTQVVFKTQMTSFHMLCFYKAFIVGVCQKRKNRAQMWEQYNSNLCKLTNKEQNQFQKEIFFIQKKVLTFQDFFKFTGLKQRQEQQVKKMLKSAIKNSERKKYHGDFELLHELPPSNEQIEKLLQNAPSYAKFIQVKSQQKQEGEKKTYIFNIKQKKSQDQDWKVMCTERWSWIKEALSYDQKLTAKQISEKAINYAQQGIAKPEDRLMKVIKQRYLSQNINYNQPKINTPQVNWKQIFLRLDLEDFLLKIDMNPEFHQFYQKIEVCKACNVNTLLIPFIEIHNLKSGYYYLTALLTKLTTLKYIEFSGLPNMSNIITEKAAKAMKKGFANFVKEGGKVQIVSFYNLSITKNLSDEMFSFLASNESLISFRLSKINFFNYGSTMKVVSNALANLKNIQQIKLNQCQLNQDKCKILADTLMRMKKLRIFEISDINVLGQGLEALIYNLSFSPNLLKLNISSCNLGANNQDINKVIVALYKLLKISASIEILKAKNVNSLNNNLSKDFWTGLGQCRSLRVLDIERSGDLTLKKDQIGKAVAFNAKKKGVLQYINMTGCIKNNSTINGLYNAMWISQFDEEQLYGDPNKVSKMIQQNYKKVYYNNLKALQLDYSTSLNPNFNLAHFNKLIQKKDPQYVKLIAQSPNLQTLALRQSGLAKNISDVLVLALDPRRADTVSKIKVLDLAKNNLGKDAIKTLCEVLPYNNIIEVLDLSKNQLGVSGASHIAVAFKENKSLKYLNLFNNKVGYDGAKAIAENIVAVHPKLEFLQLGHNRIRNKGLKAIVDSLIDSKNTNLRILGLRFNFLTNVGITYLYNKIQGSKTKVQQLFIKNNLMDDRGLYNLNKIYTEDKSKLNIDIIGKVRLLQQQRSDRTIWIHPIQGINLQNLKKYFENTHKTGIVLDIRVRKGKQYPNRNAIGNLFGFVQFADSTSVTRALNLASQKKTTLDGIAFRIYKAGTGTFLFQKKTAKQKKIEYATNTLPTVPYAIQKVIRQMRPPINRVPRRGRGGRRGRDRNQRR